MSEQSGFICKHFEEDFLISHGNIRFGDMVWNVVLSNTGDLE